MHFPFFLNEILQTLHFEKRLSFRMEAKFVFLLIITINQYELNDGQRRKHRRLITVALISLLVCS